MANQFTNSINELRTFFRTIDASAPQTITLLKDLRSALNALNSNPLNTLADSAAQLQTKLDKLTTSFKANVNMERRFQSYLSAVQAAEKIADLGGTRPTRPGPPPYPRRTLANLYPFRAPYDARFAEDVTYNQVKMTPSQYALVRRQEAFDPQNIFGAGSRKPPVYSAVKEALSEILKGQSSADILREDAGVQTLLKQLGSRGFVDIKKDAQTGAVSITGRTSLADALKNYEIERDRLLRAKFSSETFFGAAGTALGGTTALEDAYGKGTLRRLFEGEKVNPTQIYQSSVETATGLSRGGNLNASAQAMRQLGAAVSDLLATYNNFTTATVKAGNAQLSLNDIARKSAAAFNAMANYVSGPRQKELPLENYLKQGSGSFDSIRDFLGSLSSGFGGQAGLKNLEQTLSKYGYTLDMLSSVKKEASTGITRLGFDKAFEVTDDSGNTKRFFEDLSVAMDRSGNVLKDTQNRFRSFASSIARDLVEVTKWTIAVNLVYAPMQKFGELMNEMTANQAKLSSVMIVTGQSNEEVYSTFVALTEVANKTSEDLTDTVDAYQMAYIAAGNMANEYERAAVSTALLSDALTLAKLSGLSEKESLDILSASLKQLGMPLTDGYKLIDKWIDVTKSANVNLATLATSYSIVASAAEDVGLKLDDLNGVIAAFSEVSSLSATETGNAVRAFISGFQTESANKALAKYGVSIYDTTGKLRNFMDVMREIKSLGPIEQGGSGLITKEQMARLADIVGGGARRGAQVSSFISNLGRVDQIAEISKLAGGGAYEALATRTETLESANNRLANTFAKLAQTLGTKGGLLEGATNLVDTFAALLDRVDSLFGAVGKLGPALLTAAGALLYISKINPVAGANLTNWLGDKAFNVGARLGNFIGGAINPNSRLGSMLPAGVLANLQNVGSRDQLISKNFALLYPNHPASQAFTMGGGPGNVANVAVKGQASVAQQWGDAFARKIRGVGSEWAVTGAVVFTSTLSTFMSGDTGKGIGEVIGGTIGAVTLKAAPQVGAIIGVAAADILTNALRSTPDISAGLAQGLIDAQRKTKSYGEQTAEEKKETAKDRLTKAEQALRMSALETLTLKAPYGTNLDKNIGNYLQQGDFGGALGLALEGVSQMPLAFLFGDSGLNAGVNFNYDVNKMFNPTMPVTKEQYGLEYLFNFASQKQIDDYLKAFKAYASTEGGELGAGAGNPASQKIAEVQNAFASIMGGEGGIRSKLKTKALSDLSMGEINPSTYRATTEFLDALPTSLATIWSFGGEAFTKLVPGLEDTTKAYEELASVITDLTPEEREELVKLSSAVKDAYNQVALGVEGISNDDVLKAQQELVKVLNAIYTAKKLNEFKLPSKLSTDAYTMPEAQMIYQAGIQARDNFLDSFITNPEIKESFIKQFEDVAIGIAGPGGKEAGVEFWTKFGGVGSEFMQEGMKKLMEQGLLKAKDMSIQPMMDTSRDTLYNRIMPLTRQYESLLEKAGFPAKKETFGVILENFDPQELNANMLAFRLAQEKTNELLQKQLDGIYNLPEGATFWIPEQAARLSKKTAEAIGTPTTTNPLNVEEALALMRSVINSVKENLRGLGLMRPDTNDPTTKIPVDTNDPSTTGKYTPFDFTKLPTMYNVPYKDVLQTQTQPELPNVDVKLTSNITVHLDGRVISEQIASNFIRNLLRSALGRGNSSIVIGQ